MHECKKCFQKRTNEARIKKKLENPSKYRKHDSVNRRLHRINNPAIERAAKAKRRALQNNAIPKCLTLEDFDDIKTYYFVREQLSRDGAIYHVDHIIPLNNDVVCGLHVPWNLRILAASENMSKSNLFIEELSIDLSAEYYRSTYLS